MSSPHQQVKAAPNDGFWFRTPPAKSAASEEDEEKARFAEYGLSPPPLQREGRQTFKETVAKIKNDYPEVWDRGSKEKKKILLFLYSRGVYHGEEQHEPLYTGLCCRFLNLINGHSGENSQPDRKDALDRFLEEGGVRKRMMLVIDAEGDRDVSSTKSEHYAITCMAILRYFEQQDATGFLNDMSTLTVYLRNLKYCSCFVQSACVCTSYLLQSHGRDVPPPDASRFIRHNFDDDQLYKYIVADEGGDSFVMYKILEKQFFDCRMQTHTNMTTYFSARLASNPGMVESLRNDIREGPGLVSMFRCTKNFRVVMETSDKKCGYARFTEWDQPAEFVHLPNSAHTDAKTEEQKSLFNKWKASCVASNENTFDLPGDVTLAKISTATSSMSLNESGDRGNYASSDRECPGELSSEGIGDRDEESDSDDDQEEEEKEGSSQGEESDSDDDQEEEEGSSQGEESDDLHSMIIIGFREVNGETFWLLQNSWSQMRLIEMSTQYLAESGACIATIDPATRQVREKARSPILCSPARVAESHKLERADCGRWDEGDIYPALG